MIWTPENRISVLLAIYREVSEHLRDTDTKRDRMFNVYVTIVLAVVSALVVLRMNVRPLSAVIPGTQ